MLMKIDVEACGGVVTQRFVILWILTNIASFTRNFTHMSNKKLETNSSSELFFTPFLICHLDLFAFSVEIIHF